jgi:chain length determinant protein tyrosine kinase EpsG
MSDLSGEHPREMANQLPADDMRERVEAELIRIGRLSERQVARAKEIQERQGISFLEAAIATRAVTREVMMAALSTQFNYPIIHGDSVGTRFSRELIAGHEPFSAATEELRSIRTALVSSALVKGVRSLAIVGGRSGMGSSYFAGNLAIAFAQMSLNTLIVDTNIRDPRLAEMFGFDRNREGLSDVILKKTTDNVPIIEGIMPGLSLLTSGTIPPNPQELLCSEEFLSMTINFNRDYGVVIYDTPSALEYADAYIVASRVGAAVLVARKNRATFKDVSSMTNKLRSFECNVVGSVLNSG